MRGRWNSKFYCLITKLASLVRLESSPELPLPMARASSSLLLRSLTGAQGIPRLHYGHCASLPTMQSSAGPQQHSRHQPNKDVSSPSISSGPTSLREHTLDGSVEGCCRGHLCQLTGGLWLIIGLNGKVRSHQWCSGFLGFFFLLTKPL